ncbi:AraC family transcriptional regulator [Larkinella ripae]
MFYQKHQPAAHLRPFVECYYVWEHTQPIIQPLTVESPPNGYGSLVFNYGTPCELQTPKRGRVVVPTAFLSGQATGSYQLQLQGQIGMIGAVFRPAGLSSLFGLPMYEFTDERIDLAAVLGDRIKTVQNRMHETGSTAGRVELLEMFLTSQLVRTGAVTDRTDYVADVIVQQGGIININELMDELYVCRRQFERKFLHKVGVSPKYYARIRRISYLCAQLAVKRWNVQDWHDLVYRAGYYDQSHFIREFTGFTGRRPSSYVRDNAELANFLQA